MEEIDPKDIIVLDESGANLGMASDYSRALGGSRAKSPKPHCPGKRYSIIGAISLEKIEAMMYVEGPVNAEIFEGFLTEILIPQVKHGQYLVLDNVRFHKTETIIALLKAAGVSVVFLPPYSPDLSPIEKMWSKIKGFLKRLKPRTEGDFHQFLVQAIDAVTDRDLEAWYDECGYAV